MINFTFGKHQIGSKYPPLFVGVLNLSPESFYKNSTAVTEKAILQKASDLISEGAQQLDVGALSTRPLPLYGGKQQTPGKIELQRLQILPKLIELADDNSVDVAVDTQTASVAEYAFDTGARIINDVSGLTADKALANVIAKYEGWIVLMAAANGKPGAVNGIAGTHAALQHSVSTAREAGIENNRLLIDPGFGGWQGRGSTTDIELIKGFQQFQRYNLPIYVGVSRKSTVGAINGGDHPGERLAGSLVLTNYLIDQGANVIRTHDVRATILAYQTYTSLKRIT